MEFVGIFYDRLHISPLPNGATELQITRLINRALNLRFLEEGLEPVVSVDLGPGFAIARMISPEIAAYGLDKDLLFYGQPLVIRLANAGDDAAVLGNMVMQNRPAFVPPRHDSSDESDDE